MAGGQRRHHAGQLQARRRVVPGTGDRRGYVVTSDPDRLYERVLSHKADIVRPLCKTDYGANEFTVRDPEGNLWSFGDYAGEPR